MSEVVTVQISTDDAAIVGATLRVLARVNYCPDPSVGERLARVGDQMAKAARLELAGVMQALVKLPPRAP